MPDSTRTDDEAFWIKLEALIRKIYREEAARDLAQFEEAGLVEAERVARKLIQERRLEHWDGNKDG